MSQRREAIKGVPHAGNAKHPDLAEEALVVIEFGGEEPPARLLVADGAVGVRCVDNEH